VISVSRLRYCVLLIYTIALHALMAWLLLDPNGVSRFEELLPNTTAYQREYRGMVAAHTVLTRSVPNGAVVFLGDSRMGDLDVSMIVDGPVYNLSISGDTTEGLRARLTQYHHLDKCKLVVLGTGVNDLMQSTDEHSLHEYEAMLGFLKDSAVRRVAVCSVLPIDETNFERAHAARLRPHRLTNERIMAYNRRLGDLCARYTFVNFLTASAEFSEPSGNLHAYLSADGLHLSDEGNRVWVAALRRSLTAIADQ
jgi:lysophospholipase L1-like esterase